MAKSAPLTRVIVGPEGERTTYLEMKEITSRAGVPRATLSRWALAGAVRSLPPIKNRNYLALADVLRVEFASLDERREMTLTDEKTMQSIEKWQKQADSNTSKTATQSGEPWADKDVETLVEMFESGFSIEEIAIKLERTWCATGHKIHELRAEKEVGIRRARHDRIEVTDGLLTFLTPEERAEFS